MSNEEVRGQPTIHVPTVGPHTIAFPRGSGFTISGLRQKLALIGDNLAVGWAGHRVAAQTVVKEMIEQNRYTPFTLSTLVSYLDNLPKVGINEDFALVGWLKEGSRVQGFGFRSLEFRSDKFGKVGLLGSGAKDLRDYLTAYPDSPEWNTSHPWQSFSTGLLLGGFLLRVEMKNLSSLHQYYGAGYEIVGMEQGSFRKLDNVTFAFWEASLRGKRVTFTLQPRILKYSYRGDLLLIRSLTIDHPLGSANAVATSRVDAIAPIHRVITDEEGNVSPPEMNSQILCNYFLIKLPNRVSKSLAEFTTS